MTATTSKPCTANWVCPVPPQRDDYAWDAAPGWVLPAWIDQFKVVA